MPKMVCVNCQVEYRPIQNDAYVIEYFSDPPQPYKIWAADGWACPICGHLVMAGFATVCLAEHYEPNFQHVLDRINRLKEEKEYWIVNDYEVKHRPIGA